MTNKYENWSDERLIGQLQTTRKFKPYKNEVKRHQQVLAELEAEVARRQAARNDEEPPL